MAFTVSENINKSLSEALSLSQADLSLLLVFISPGPPGCILLYQRLWGSLSCFSLLKK